jgi:Domain of unknown function (DUF4413)
MIGIMGIAAVLDPRFKTLILEFYYEKLYGANHMHEVNKVVDLCHELVGEYQRRSKQEGDKPSSGGDEQIERSEEMKAFDLFIERRKRQKVHSRTELDYYLEAIIFPMVSDLMCWVGGKLVVLDIIFCRKLLEIYMQYHFQLLPLNLHLAWGVN